MDQPPCSCLKSIFRFIPDSTFFDRYSSFIIFSATLLLCLMNLHLRPEFIAIDSRFALFVHEMLENGEFFWPTLHGKPYPDYTGFPTFLSMTAARITGKVNYFSLVFPSAAAAALLNVLTWKIGERLFNKKIALTAVFLSFGSFTLVSIYRIASCDLYPALVSAAGVYITVAAIEEQKEKHIYLTLPLLIFGYLGRGPIGAIVPAACICSVLLAERKYSLMISFGRFAAYLTFLLLIIWCCGIYFKGGIDQLNDCLYMQITHRMSKGRPFWYYFADAAGSFAFMYPAALITTVLYIRKFKTGLLEDKKLRPFLICAAWMLCVAIGFSIPGTKHLRYITPLMPAAALIAAHLFWNVHRIREIRFLRKLFFMLATPVSFLAIPGFLGTQLILSHPWVENKLHCSVELPVISGTIILLLLNLAVLFSRRARRFRRLVILGVMCLLVAFLRIMIVEPIEDSILNSRSFTAKCEALRGDQPMGFFALGPDGDENKYMVNVARHRQFVPFYVSKTDLRAETCKRTAKLPRGAMITARLDRWKKLDKKITRIWEPVASGRIGRRDCILLKKKTF